MESVFFGDMCVGENTAQAANVRASECAAAACKRLAEKAAAFFDKFNLREK